MSKLLNIVLLIIFTLSLGCKKEQEADDTVIEYLKNNRAAISFNDLKTAQNVFTDSLMRAHEVFFASEFHAVASNTQMRLFFIKLLHTQTDTLCYFPELSFSACQMLNQYLEMGDENLLQSIYDNYNGTFEFTRENYTFWQQLRAYRQGLTGKKRLVVVGCDVEHQPATALRYIRQLLGTNAPPAAIATTVEALRNKTTISYRSNTDMTWFRQQTDAFTTNKAVFQQFLGEKTFDFELTLGNMQKAADVVSQGSLGIRENELWENFKKLYPRTPKGKWFGQWGAYHTLQRATHSSFANFIKTRAESPAAGKVLTIQTLYGNGSYMNQVSFQPIEFTNLDKGEPYSDLATANFMLFNLNNTNSPFQKQLKWWGTDEPLDGGTVVDYFQFIFYVRNAGAMTPFK